jgi:hypothetical protein
MSVTPDRCLAIHLLHDGIVRSQMIEPGERGEFNTVQIVADLVRVIGRPRGPAWAPAFG